MDVKGLNRNAIETVFITLYEPHRFDYVDPYVLYNPYKVWVSLRNFDVAPRSSFKFLWTIKNFPPSVAADDRYVSGLPDNPEIASYQQVAESEYIPIFPDETYRVQLLWKNGVAKLIVNEYELAEHRYRPLIYNPQSLVLVLGKTPETKLFPIPDLTFSNLVVTFPEFQ